MCIYCGNIYKNHLSNPPQASDLLKAGVLGTNQDLANYLTSGFWNDSSTEARKFNLTNTGVNAKNGLLTYNTTGNSYDSDGISYSRSLLVDESFKLLENTLGIDFQKTTNPNADIRFSDSYSAAYAYSIYSSGYINYANINISDNWNGYRNGFGNYTFQTILHEIGHSLGLGHQGFYNGSGSYLNDANYKNDSWQSSIMSYFSQSANTCINASFAYLSTFSAIDLIALENLYGPQGFSLSNAFSGDTIYGFNTNISSSTSQIFSELANLINSTAFTIADGNGNDSLDFSGFSNNQSIDLRSTDINSSSLFASNIAGLDGNLVISEGTIIENAIGGLGNDTITGNSSNNYLNGGKGNDFLIGGLGDDTFVVDSKLDNINENLNEGIDLILSSVSYTLPSNVEKIILTGSSDLNATGNNLDNTLKGNSGINELDGKDGTDIAIFDGSFNDYSLSVSNENLIINDARSNSPNGIKTLKSIEIAEFSDSNKTINELFNILCTIKKSNYSAADLKNFDANTRVIINASAVKSLTGNASDLVHCYESSGISGLENETIIISDKSVDASLINTLDANTTGIINVSSVESLTGSASALVSCYQSPRIIGLGNELITVSSGESSVSLANILSEATSGIVTATLSDGDITTLLKIKGNKNAYKINISEKSVYASKFNELYEKTTAKINASNIEELTGTTSDLNRIYSSFDINGLGNEKVTISDSYIDASILNVLDSNTTGIINASSVKKLVGLSSEINTALSSNGISDGGSDPPIWLSYFESLKYLASHKDLINIFGLNSYNAKLHYINHGQSEGRSLSNFNAVEYLNNYSDLKSAFIYDEVLALEHYIQYGHKEGRTDISINISNSESTKTNLTDFQALNYIASNEDLISAFGNDLEAAKSHYSNHDESEGRDLDNFDEWGYLASNSDLITEFGIDTIRAIKHFIYFGKEEGRLTNLFNAETYLNKYPDLSNAFGKDFDAAKKHFVEYGFFEGRIS